MNHVDGMQFSSDGPIMQGTWFNPETGHKFTVRDCFFQDNNFVVLTTDGQTLDYNTLQNYIQATDNQGKETNITQDMMSNKKQDPNLPPEVAAMLADDDDAQDEKYLTEEDKALTRGLGNINQPRHITPASQHEVSQTQPTHNEPYNQDMAMVERVLRRHPVPDFEAQLVWSTPTKQIETLVDILGIEPEIIADYYVNKLDQVTIFDNIKRQLSDYIVKLCSPDAQIEQVVADAPVRPVAKTPKKKKQKL